VVCVLGGGGGKAKIEKVAELSADQKFQRKISNKIIQNSVVSGFPPACPSSDPGSSACARGVLQFPFQDTELNAVGEEFEFTQ